MPETTWVIKAGDVDIPAIRAKVTEVDFQIHKIKSRDRAMAMLAILVGQNAMITKELLQSAIHLKFSELVATDIIQFVDRVCHDMLPPDVSLS